ncbi:type VI secretion system protein TssA [Tautonia rosea]|uniref:type VI secretion system protein TssA n=1 Tax=Tautonia rosea TaxID=2728037 RepID=UPI0014745521|nr:type VI secretion system protein TssA [Tautonia rosea]
MASAQFLDLDSLLTPISEDRPAGDDLRWEDEFAQLEAARESDEDASSRDIYERDRKLADFDAVISLGTDLLRERTKDLRIAAFVADALARRFGLPGLRDGLILIRQMQERFWETMHPEPEDGDLELREGVIEWLDGDRSLPLILRSVPLTHALGDLCYSFFRYKESRDVEQAIAKNPDRADEFKAEGKIRAEDFDNAVKATDESFYRTLLMQVRDCRTSIDQLNESLSAEEHYGRKGPRLSACVSAIEDVSKIVEKLVKSRGITEEPPEPPDEVEEDVEADEFREEEFLEDEPSESLPFDEPKRPVPSSRSRSSSGPILDTSDARRRIAEAARFLQGTDASDPVPYLVVRALTMGDFYRITGCPSSSELPAIPTEIRREARRLADDQDWESLLQVCERALGEPGGLGWLDDHRYAMLALDQLGHDHARRAVQAMLLAWLADYPDWPECEMDDETPCASRETRAWLAELQPTEEPEPEAESEPEPEPEPEPPQRLPDNLGSQDLATEFQEPDPWDRARDLFESGNNAEALSVMARAVREARTGRERFLRALQQAELCLAMNRPSIAGSLFDDLARQIDEFRLERWEEAELCARVFAGLYRCVRDDDPERAKDVYHRLCQFDIRLAVQLGDNH